MGTNAQKTHLVTALNKVALQRAAGLIQLLGKSLPCSVVAVTPTNAVVTVKFEINSPFTLPVVTVPVIGFEYIRYPVKIGDKGRVSASDAYLGGVTGLGGGTADLSQNANLTDLVFEPLGSTLWATTDDPNAVVIYAPNGAILRTTDASVKVTVNESGVDVVGATTFHQLVTAVVDAVIDNISFKSHYHEQSGGGNTGPPQGSP